MPSGSAARNVEPIIQALTPLLSDIPASSSTPVVSASSRPRILELASYPYEHIAVFAKEWEDWEWWGTARDEKEISTVNGGLANEWEGLANLSPPRQLDIGHGQDWDALRDEIAHEAGARKFSGTIMLNLIHCCPPELPAHIFRNLSPLTEGGRALLDPEDGWIVAYGAFKDDGGSYRSSADEEVSWSLRLLSSLYRATVGPPDAEQFDKTYIKATHASLGLRTIRSITDVAEQWGFVEDCRKEMPKGNMFVVWRVRSNR